MDSLKNILEGGTTNVIVQVNAQDLMRFAEVIYEKAQTDALQLLSQKEENDLISKKETKALLGGVSDATLWRWEKDGYLVPERLGRKIVYRKSDILGLISSHQR